MSLTFKELSFEEAHDVWVEFSEDIGVEHMRQTYGRYWPRYPVANEKVYTVFDEREQKVGWVAIRPDVIDPMAWQCSGVFEKHRSHGYSKMILQWSAKKCFEVWPVETMLFEISNHTLLQSYIQYHIKRIFNKVVPGEYAAGFIDTPAPGYTIFGVKKSEE